MDILTVIVAIIVAGLIYRPAQHIGQEIRELHEMGTRYQEIVIMCLLSAVAGLLPVVIFRLIFPI